MSELFTLCPLKNNRCSVTRPRRQYKGTDEIREIFRDRHPVEGVTDCPFIPFSVKRRSTAPIDRSTNRPIVEGPKGVVDSNHRVTSGSLKTNSVDLGRLRRKFFVHSFFLRKIVSRSLLQVCTGTVPTV